MRATRVIAGHELARLLASPMAWCMAAATELLAGLLFVMSLTDIVQNPNHLDAYDGVSAAVGGGLFRFVTLLLLFIVPLLTMRSLAEEAKTGTLELLRAAPLSSTALVLGKFIGLMGYLSLLWLLVAAMPATLALFTPLDPGLVAAGLIGLWLVMAAFTALGLFTSSLTGEPILAGMLSLAGLLLAWLAYAVSTIDWQPRVFGHALDLGAAARGLSPIGHHDALLRGLFSSADLAYFVLFVALFLALAILRLDAARRGS